MIQTWLLHNKKEFRLTAIIMLHSSI